MKEHDFEVRLLVTDLEMKLAVEKKGIIQQVVNSATRKWGPDVPIVVWLNAHSLPDQENAVLRYIGATRGTTAAPDKFFQPPHYYTERDAYQLARLTTGKDYLK